MEVVSDDGIQDVLLRGWNSVAGSDTEMYQKVQHLITTFFKWKFFSGFSLKPKSINYFDEFNVG